MAIVRERNLRLAFPIVNSCAPFHVKPAAKDNEKLIRCHCAKNQYFRGHFPRCLVRHSISGINHESFLFGLANTGPGYHIKRRSIFNRRSRMKSIDGEAGEGQTSRHRCLSFARQRMRSLSELSNTFPSRWFSPWTVLNRREVTNRMVTETFKPSDSSGKHHQH